jgi:hypothetical protein
MGNSKSSKSSIIDNDMLDNKNYQVRIIVNNKNGIVNKQLTLKEIKKGSTSKFYYYTVDVEIYKLINTGISFNIEIHLGFDKKYNEIIKRHYIPENYKDTAKYDYLCLSKNIVDNKEYMDISYNKVGIILRHTYDNKSYLKELVLLNNAFQQNNK